MLNNNLEKSNDLQTADQSQASPVSQNLKDQIISLARNSYDRGAKGFTDFWLMSRLSKPRNVVSSARNLLCKEGRIVDTKSKYKGRGKEEILWCYCPNPKPLQQLTPGQKIRVIKQILAAPVDSILKTMDIEKVLNDKFFDSELQSLA